MRGEDIYEDGIVTASGQGNAIVTVPRSENCDECSAKIICGISDKDENTVEATDPFGVCVGDEVRIRIRGESLFAAATILYGIPLLLVLAGILFGTYVFHPDVMRQELWACSLGFGSATVYYIILFFNKTAFRRKSFMPDIISVRTNREKETAH